jgi:hypothetical protein
VRLLERARFGEPAPLSNAAGLLNARGPPSNAEGHVLDAYGVSNPTASARARLSNGGRLSNRRAFAVMRSLSNVRCFSNGRGFAVVRLVERAAC